MTEPAPQPAPPAAGAPAGRARAFRAGVVALVGRTNAGKSTLVNKLVGRKVSIVTPKPQTTRDPIHGVVNRPGGQLVFVDTPGFFKTHASKLVDSLHQKAREALEGVDAVVHVADPSRAVGAEDDMVTQALAGVAVPRLLCLTKYDLERRPFREDWLKRAPDYRAFIEVSAVSGHNLKTFVRTLLDLMPAGELLYPPGEVTNAHRDFRMAEIIREKVYLLTGDEVPYRTSVEFHGTEERRDRGGLRLLVIKASILVINNHYKGMLIGAGGRKIKAIGVAARRDLEKMVARKVFLDMDVVVDRQLPK